MTLSAKGMPYLFCKFRGDRPDTVREHPVMVDDIVHFLPLICSQTDRSFRAAKGLREASSVKCWKADDIVEDSQPVTDRRGCDPTLFGVLKRRNCKHGMGTKLGLAVAQELKPAASDLETMQQESANAFAYKGGTIYFPIPSVPGSRLFQIRALSTDYGRTVVGLHPESPPKTHQREPNIRYIDWRVWSHSDEKFLIFGVFPDLR